MQFGRDLKRSTAPRVPIPALASATLAIAMVALAPFGRAVGESTTPEEASPISASAIEVVDGDLQLVPIIRVLNRTRDMFVTLAIRNNSPRPVRFCRGGRFGLESLDLRLTYQDGTDVPYAETDSSRQWFKEPVEVLDPGETLPIRISLCEFGFDGIHGNFPAGRFELRAVQSPTAHAGSTPMRIDRTIMLFDFAGGPLPPKVNRVRTAVIAMVCVAVVEGIALAGVCWCVWRSRQHCD